MIASSFVYILMIFIYGDADGKKFKPDANVIHVQNLNFVLKSTIFVHYNGHLWASHLILNCTPVYTSYKDPGQALTVDSPLLSYIDVRHRRFLPPRLTVGEAQDLNPQLIRVGSLLPVRDETTDIVFQRRVEHILVKQPLEGV